MHKNMCMVSFWLLDSCIVSPTHVNKCENICNGTRYQLMPLYSFINSASISLEFKFVKNFFRCSECSWLEHFVTSLLSDMIKINKNLFILLGHMYVISVKRALHALWHRSHVFLVKNNSNLDNLRYGTLHSSNCKAHVRTPVRTDPLI